MNKFVLKNIESVKGTIKETKQETKDLIQRLYDLGLHPGLEVEVVARVSFNSVTIIQFGETRLALNDEEYSCLRGL